MTSNLDAEVIRQLASGSDRERLAHIKVFSEIEALNEKHGIKVGLDDDMKDLIVNVIQRGFMTTYRKDKR